MKFSLFIPRERFRSTEAGSLFFGVHLTGDIDSCNSARTTKTPWVKILRHWTCCMNVRFGFKKSCALITSKQIRDVKYSEDLNVQRNHSQQKEFVSHSLLLLDLRMADIHAITFNGCTAFNSHCAGRIQLLSSSTDT